MSRVVVLAILVLHHVLQPFDVVFRQLRLVHSLLQQVYFRVVQLVVVVCVQDSEDTCQGLLVFWGKGSLCWVDERSQRVDDNALSEVQHLDYVGILFRGYFDAQFDLL